MASEHPNAKKEPPWLLSPLLPPMPRISVSPNGPRARLSHRRPILLSPPSPTILPLPSPPCMPSPSPPCTAADLEVTPHSSQAASPDRLDCLGIASPADAPSSEASDSLFKSADENSSLSNDEYSRNQGFPCAAAAPAPCQFVPPPPLSNFDESAAAANDSYLPLSVPIFEDIPSRPAPLPTTPTLQHYCEDDDHRLQMPLVVEGVEEAAAAAEDPLPGKPINDSSASSDVGLSVAERTSSPIRLNGLEKVENHTGAAIVIVSSEAAEVVSDDLELTNGELPVDECELEEGQLPGEWSGSEESSEESESVQVSNEKSEDPPPPVLEGSPSTPPTARETVNTVGHFYYPYQIGEITYEDERSRGNNKAKGKNKKKHKKGEGSRKRSREKSRDKYNEVLKKRRAEGKEVDNASNNARGARPGKGTVDRGEQTPNGSGIGQFKKKVPEKASQTRPSKPVVDEGPEDGEILLESTKSSNGLLSSLVEAEVGLWTTDDVDEQLVTEMEEDGAVKKKRGPETAERKLKRKIAKRKKRAQKERELGIRRPPRTVQTKPVKVLCTHYMKGRCAKGDQCTFSHDAVPLTKQEPCKFLMSHSCLKGDDCPYSHDLRAFPCKFFHTRGFCYDGENCQFSHGAISQEALEKLNKRVEKEKKDRISSVNAFDIPTPTFSTPLPPELDPDPLGWGTQSQSYPIHEEGTQYTNPATLGMPSHVYDDLDLENYPSGPPTAAMSSGLPPSIGRKDTGSDTKEDPSNCEYLLSGNLIPALGSGSTSDVRRFKRETDLPLLLSSTEGRHTSSTSNVLNLPVCQPPPNERSNARNVLEASVMEEGMDAKQTVQEEPLNNPRVQDLLPVASPSMSPAPARNSAGTLVPVLRVRQLGSRMLAHDKVLQSPTLAVGRRQHTVESLLDEALRQ